MRGGLLHIVGLEIRKRYMNKPLNFLLHQLLATFDEFYAKVFTASV